MQAVGDSTAMCSNVIYANERRETSSPAITLDYCTHTAINLRPNTNNTEESVALPALTRRLGAGAGAGAQTPAARDALAQKGLLRRLRRFRTALSPALRHEPFFREWGRGRPSSLGW